MRPETHSPQSAAPSFSAGLMNSSPTSAPYSTRRRPPSPPRALYVSRSEPLVEATLGAGASNPVILSREDSKSSCAEHRHHSKLELSCGYAKKKPPIQQGSAGTSQRATRAGGGRVTQRRFTRSLLPAPAEAPSPRGRAAGPLPS